MICGNDASFGPGADCRELDFTLFFSNIFLTFVPALCLIILGTPRILHVWRDKSRKIRPWSHLPTAGKCLLLGRIVSAVGLIAAQVGLIVMRHRAETMGDETAGWSGWLADCVELVGMSLLAPLVILEHYRNNRPSQLSALYLLCSTLCLGSRLRTHALISRSSQLIGPLSASLILRCALFVLLQISTRSSLDDSDVPPGATSGLVSRYLIAWVLPLLWRGFRNPLKLKDLGEIDTSLHTSSTWTAFSPHWTAVQSVIASRLSDLPPPSPDPAGKKSSKKSKGGKAPPRQPLLMSLIRSFWPALSAPLLPALISCLASIARPLLISRTITFVQSHSTPNPAPVSDGWGLVGAAALTYAVYSLSYALMHVAIQKSALLVRGALMEALYRKSLVIRVDTAVEMGAAKASNLMSVDVDNVVRELNAVHDVWTALVLTGLGLYVIYTQIGISFLASVVGAIIFFAVLPLCTRHIGATRTIWADNTDRRIKFTSSVIRHIKAIKLSAYERRIALLADKMRHEELVAFVNWVKEVLKVSILTNWLAHFLSLLTIVTFTLVVLYAPSAASVGGESQGVTTARIFTVVSTIELISFPLLMLGQKLGALITAWASLKRVEGFLLGEERDPREVEAVVSETSTIDEASTAGRGVELVQVQPSDDTRRIDFTKATFGVRDKITLLRDLDIHLRDPGLWMITGRVGCGKSSLLQALINELDLLSDFSTSNINLGTVGYCSQDPWLRANASVRENITFIRSYEKDWYGSVIKALALDVDLGNFSEGDRTLVSNLSGGQKQRVALARAVYGQFDSLVLDDVFSALDATTESRVFSALFDPSAGLLRDKTVVLATNQVYRLPYANYLTILEGGVIAEQGTYPELSSKGGMLRTLIEEFAAGAAEKEEHKKVDAATAAASGTVSGSDAIDITDALSEPVQQQPQVATHRSVLDNPSHRSGSMNGSDSSSGSGHTILSYAQEVAPDENSTGKVPWAVYSLYLRGIGYVSAVFWVSAVVVNAVIQLCVGIYLQAWTGVLGSTSPDERWRYGQFLGGYAGMTLGYLVAFVAAIVNAFVYAHPTASRRLHTWMMASVLRTSLDFFESTPIGQIVNRFNSDMNMLDMTLPNHAVNVMFVATTVLGSAVLITVANQIMAAVVAGTAIFMILLQRFYVRAGRELRRLDLSTRSPIYTLFSETIDPDGLRTIRAMKAESRSQGLMTRRATDSQYPTWLLMAIQKWLELALNIAVAGVNTLLVLLAVLNRSSTNAGLLAVAMTQAATLNTNVSTLVVEWTNVEMCITSVERIYEYIQLPPQRDSGDPLLQHTHHDEDDDGPGSSKLGGAIADEDDEEDDYGKGKAISLKSSSKGKSKARNRSKAKGSIVFRNVTARYAPHLPPALTDLSLAIKPGQRVGICGRTGSGKSTLLAVLWRLIEYDEEEGEVMVGGKEIGTTTLGVYRDGMSIIPQDPLLLDLTMRENLDLEGRHADGEIWDALERAQLKSHVSSLPLGLSTPITDTSLSRGQRQLLALARAILRARPILALDEATSSIDAETDASIQRTIRESFDGATILTIAHRIGTIVDYDVVVVMDKGRVVETGEPGMLIESGRGRFWELARESGLI